MKMPICIYHKGCVDGFGAAWVVDYWAHENGVPMDFHPAMYQDDPPDVSERTVLIVDFSYKRPVLERMAETAEAILILDHHKTAAEDLSGYPEPPVHPEHRGWIPDSGIYATFDMERSGAGITWDHFYLQPRPELINYIEDRDLWRFALPGTREIQAALYSYPQDFRVWDKFMIDADLSYLRNEGAAINRSHEKNVESLARSLMREMEIDGHVVPVANAPYMFASDLGHKLAEGKPFAACYWDAEDGRTFSLRSTDDGEDVSAIAKKYGGGGHRNAAGFRVPLDQAGRFEVGTSE